MEATGTGHPIWRIGKKIQLLELDAGQSISVNGNDVLAFESSVNYEIRTVKEHRRLLGWRRHDQRLPRGSRQRRDHDPR